MKLGKTLYVTNRKGWPAWFMKNHSREKEIWLIYYKQHSGKRSFGDKQGTRPPIDHTFVAADDIISELKKDEKTWKNFRAFPQSYQRIHVGWIDASRHRPEIFRTRLRYFLKMTAQNKKFGMVQ